MSEVVLNAFVRTETGKAAHRLRSEDKIPGVYYSRGEENINIAATPLAMKPLIYTTNTHLINLKLDNGVTKSCVLREVQFDPLTDRPVHFDLQGVKENEELMVQVPVILHGSPKGVKDGGLLQFIMHKVRVSCLPKFGLGLEDVAFTWAYTTQSITRDFKAIRDGLYGLGPLSRLATEYPVDVPAEVKTMDGRTVAGLARVREVPRDSTQNPYIVP
ncbi:MAG: 50S ribosomal protein L25, partial [Bacteroidetes bacterium]|nr:50S ribosomal protein L25 [Bacteroidota bacterium]